MSLGTRSAIETNLKSDPDGTNSENPISEAAQLAARNVNDRSDLNEDYEGTHRQNSVLGNHHNWPNGNGIPVLPKPKTNPEY